jgi:hypothetical protein
MPASIATGVRAISSYGDRKKIAAALDEGLRRRESVNSIPEVQEARAKADRLRREHDEAYKAFSRLFDLYGDVILDVPSGEVV